MGLIGVLERTATSSWSPPQVKQQDLFSVASYGGSVDTNFDSGSQLEVYSLDLDGHLKRNSNERESEALSGQSPLVRLCSFPSEEKFLKLSWGRKLQSEERGLLAGGLSSGTVKVWDVDRLYPQGSYQPIFSSDRVKIKQPKAPVSGLEFNPFVPGCLATSGSDSEIYIWDLAVAKPIEERQVKVYSVDSSTVMGGGASASTVASAELTSLSWNKGNQKILASGHLSGLCVVWDVSQKRSVASFRDMEAKKKISCLAWSPVVPVQIITGYEEGRDSSVLVWDLRATSRPLKNLSNDLQGVSSVSWCTHDANLVVCCGKNSRIVVIHTLTGEIVADIPTESGWNFDAQFSAVLPGILSTCSLEGKVCVWNLVTSATNIPFNTQVTSNALKDTFGEEFASGLPLEISQTSPQEMKRTKESTPILAKYAPSWMRRRSGASFSFHGSLVYFGIASQTAQSSISFAFIEQTITDPNLIARNRQLQEYTNNGKVQQYCALKIEERQQSKIWRMDFGKEVSLDVWEAIALWCFTKPRQELLRRLRGENNAIPLVFEENAGDRLVGLALSPSLFSLQDIIPTQQVTSTENTEREEQTSALNINTFSGPAPWDEGWDNVENASQSDTSLVSGIDSVDLDKTKTSSKRETISKRSKLVQDLLDGNLSGAIDSAVIENRSADALILASLAGAEMFQKTRIAYLEKHWSPEIAFIVACGEQLESAQRILRSISFSENASGQKVFTWPEALSLILNYASPGQTFIELCNQLGNRLVEELNNSRAATLSFLCAGNIAMLSHHWAIEAKKVPHSNVRFRNWKWSNVDDLCEYIERLLILRTCIALSDSASLYADELNNIDEAAAKAFCDYATLLVSEGESISALIYLAPLNPETQGTFGTAGELLDRTYWNVGQATASNLGFNEPPMFPFPMEEVKKIANMPPDSNSPLMTRSNPLEENFNYQQRGFERSNQADLWTSNAFNPTAMRETSNIPRDVYSAGSQQVTTSVTATPPMYTTPSNVMMPPPPPPPHSSSSTQATSQMTSTMPQPYYTSSRQGEWNASGGTYAPMLPKASTQLTAMEPEHLQRSQTIHNVPPQAPPSFNTQQIPLPPSSTFSSVSVSPNRPGQTGLVNNNERIRQDKQMPSVLPPQSSSSVSPSWHPLPPSANATMAGNVAFKQTSSSMASSATIPSVSSTRHPFVPSASVDSYKQSQSPPGASPVYPASGGQPWYDSNTGQQSTTMQMTMTTSQGASRKTTDMAFPTSHEAALSSQLRPEGVFPSHTTQQNIGNRSEMMPTQQQPMQQMPPDANRFTPFTPSPPQQQPQEKPFVNETSKTGQVASIQQPQGNVNNFSSDKRLAAPRDSSTQMEIGKERTKTSSSSTLITADISNVPPKYKIVAETLRAFYSHCLTLNQQPIYKRKLDDVNRKLGQLFARLNNDEVKDDIGEKLIQLCKHLGQGDYDGASKIQVSLTQQHWEGNSSWIIALKRLIEAGKTGS